MNRFWFWTLTAAALLMAFSGCVVPAGAHYHATAPRPSAPQCKRYDEVQHPVINQDGRIEYVPDSIFRSWMFEPTARPPSPE